MERIAFTMQLHAGMEQEYEKRHQVIWPELTALLKEKGIRQYAIFLDEKTGRLFACLQAENRALLDSLPTHPLMQRWWQFMRDIMDTAPDGSPVTQDLREVFFLP
ncbi:MAG TPA: L-rhamnose mutarotase [Sediminibacterium sp.]|nr:L-rhamnose mutarotase [Sediminibacterium sp.]